MSGAERSNLNDSRHHENDDYEITSSFDALEQVKISHTIIYNNRYLYNSRSVSLGN